MPYILQLVTENGEVIESPFIVPDNPNSKYKLEDHKIEKSINKMGKRIIKYCLKVIKYKCIHVKKGK